MVDGRLRRSGVRTTPVGGIGRPAVLAQHDSHPVVRLEPGIDVAGQRVSAHDRLYLAAALRRSRRLEDALSMGICGPEHDWRSWTFDLDPGEVDPVLGVHWLRDAYEKAVPGAMPGST